jgi:hypothetical protein
MTGFGADWLALREPFDRAAREAAARSLDLPGLASRLRGDDSMLTVLDLACGTGANLRELAPRLCGFQRWLLVDHDPLLLGALPGAFEAWTRALGFELHPAESGLRIDGPDWSAEIQVLRIDLAVALDTVPFAGARLVTASALLDLVSVAWLDALIGHVRSTSGAALFALTVDGRATWQPRVVGDEEIHRLFMSHQRRDKGFGPAMGIEAARLAAERFALAGYEVIQTASDWRIDASDGAQGASMFNAMVDGMANAALEQAPLADALVSGWRGQRMGLTGRSCLSVGHRELLAVPRE